METETKYVIALNESLTESDLTNLNEPCLYGASPLADLQAHCGSIFERGRRPVDGPVVVTIFSRGGSVFADGLEIGLIRLAQTGTGFTWTDGTDDEDEG